MSESTDNITIGTGRIFGDFIDAYMKEHPFNEHHHESFKHLISESGIPLIITKGFVLEDTIENRRNETEEDRQISSIHFRVTFSNVRFEVPTTAGSTSTPVLLMPIEAITNGITYSAQIIVNVHIEVTAYKRDGSPPTVREVRIKNCEIAKMPTMVGSPRCNTYGNTRSELIANRQAPNDTGGYFIVKGRQFVLSSLESVQFNFNRVTKHDPPHEGELSRSMIISKPGDGFENSYQITVRYMVKQSITVEIAFPSFPMQIPFYILFRILGISSDEDIINAVVGDLTHPNEQIQKMANILAYAITQAEVPPMFADIRNERDPQKVTQFLANRTTPYKRGAASAHSGTRNKRAQRVNKQEATKLTGTTTAAPSTTASRRAAAVEPIDTLDENLLRANSNNLLAKLDKYFLPHMGLTANDRIAKLRFLGYMISQVLKVHLGVVVSTDQFSYLANRISTPGNIYSGIFKNSYNKSVIMRVKSKLRNELASTSFSNVQLETVFTSAITPTDLNKALTQSIIDGKDVVSRGQTVSKRIRAMELEHKNQLFNETCARSIDRNFTGKTPVNNQKSMDRRGVHPSILGFVCLLQSADTGDKVGRIKQMAILTRVTGGTSSEVLIRELLAKPAKGEERLIIPLNEVSDEDRVRRNLLNVFVNGRWIGFTEKNTHELADYYRKKRRNHEIDFMTTIYVDTLTLDLRFFTDSGRPIRPAFIVVDTPHGQDVLITDEDQQNLRLGKITTRDLEKRGVFEYLAPDEQDNTLIAESYRELRANAKPGGIRYTHCEIEQSILGIVALSCPFGNHTQPQRITIMTNQVKQACGWPVLNWQYRSDKHLWVQTYIQMPLVTTMTNYNTPPNGSNMIVLYTEFECRNQEDGSVFNRASSERGLLGVMNYTNRSARLEKDQQIVSPKEVNARIRQEANYDKLVNGVVPIGTIVYKNDVLIGRVEAISQEFGVIKYVDKSEISTSNEPLLVVDVIRGVSEEDGKQFIKLKLSSYRPVGMGSKISSRHGNKSIISSVVPAVDLPFTRSGIIPDLVITTHGFPKRMIFSQLIEAATAKLCAHRGASVDATAFSTLDLQFLNEELKASGITLMGYDVMVNGRTGEETAGLLCSGPTFYMRLQKFPNDTMHASAQGPTDAVTRQPIKGRAVEGGLRLGEMEKDAMCSHGIIMALYEKFVDHSDKYKMYICRSCGYPGVYNKVRQLYRCKRCRDYTQLMEVDSTWMTNVIHHNLTASYIDLKYIPAPLTFYSNQRVREPTAADEE